MTLEEPIPQADDAFAVRACWACRSEIHTEAWRCKECGSFQGWMRWFGPANLFGIVALFGTIVGIVVGVNEIRKYGAALDEVAGGVDSLRLANRYREELHSLGPSKQRLERLISLYEFNSQPDTSIDEAKLLMAFLKPLGMSYRGRGATSGTFGDLEQQRDKNEVTIWTNSYEKTNTYGVRFGHEDGSYFSCNDTYFEVAKLVGGDVSIQLEPDHFAPCPSR